MPLSDLSSPEEKKQLLQDLEMFPSDIEITQNSASILSSDQSLFALYNEKYYPTTRFWDLFSNISKDEIRLDFYVNSVVRLIIESLSTCHGSRNIQTILYTKFLESTPLIITGEGKSTSIKFKGHNKIKSITNFYSESVFQLTQSVQKISLDEFCKSEGYQGETCTKMKDVLTDLKRYTPTSEDGIEFEDESSIRLMTHIEDCCVFPTRNFKEAYLSMDGSYNELIQSAILRILHELSHLWGFDENQAKDFSEKMINKLYKGQIELPFLSETRKQSL